MGKIMALDVGAKTIGVAFCEEGMRIAFPGKTILRQENSLKRDMAALRQLVADEEVRRIVVGMPLMWDGTRGIQAEKVTAFIAALRNHVRIPIITQDERLSTSEAADLLFAGGKRRAEHKQTIDSVAAALILEWHLESAARETLSSDNKTPAAHDETRKEEPAGATDGREAREDKNQRASCIADADAQRAKSAPKKFV